MHSTSARDTRLCTCVGAGVSLLCLPGLEQVGFFLLRSFPPRLHLPVRRVHLRTPCSTARGFAETLYMWLLLVVSYLQVVPLLFWFLFFCSPLCLLPSFSRAFGSRIVSAILPHTLRFLPAVMCKAFLPFLHRVANSSELRFRLFNPSWLPRTSGSHVLGVWAA